MQSDKRRGTRGKGRKISYWDDKAVVPAKMCPECKEEIYKGRCNCAASSEINFE